MAAILSVDEAQKAILGQFSTLPAEDVPLRLAFGRILSRDIEATTDLPAFTNSSMDGYAVRAEDTFTASDAQPVRLTVIGDIPAGSVPDFVVSKGQAARIMTGAPLPSGADAVVPVEHTDAQPGPTQRLPAAVHIFQRAAPGDSLRPRGQDTQRGAVVLQRGHRLTARDLGLLAMLGFASVAVVHKPRIALLSTGDELVPAGQTPGPGEIVDSNAVTLAVQIEESGAEVLELGIAPDQAEAVRERLDRAAAAGVDLIITSAGVSVGAFDFVRQVIEQHGSLGFWRVNMRPGKPLAFGHYREVPLIGLPGNPVSAYVGMLVFILPVLRKMSGRSAALPPRIKARLTEEIESDGRESYLRAVVTRQYNGQMHVSLAGNQSSGNMVTFVRANALLIVPSGVKSLPSGTEVEIWPLTDEIE